jgi:hypothetical protein
VHLEDVGLVKAGGGPVFNAERAEVAQPLANSVEIIFPAWSERDVQPVSWRRAEACNSSEGLLHRSRLCLNGGAGKREPDGEKRLFLGKAGEEVF